MTQGQCSHSMTQPEKCPASVAAASDLSGRMRETDPLLEQDAYQRNHVSRSVGDQQSHRMTDAAQCDSLQRSEEHRRATGKCKDLCGPGNRRVLQEGSSGTSLRSWCLRGDMKHVLAGNLFHMGRARSWDHVLYSGPT